jgi:NitT/TauT family transport system substrate-binding protein
MIKIKKNIRSLFLAPVLMLGLAVLGGNDANASGPLKKVHMSHVPSLVYASLYVAIEKGYFAEQGLEVSLVIVRGGDTTYQVAGKTIEFSGGAADASFYNAINRKLPLVILSTLSSLPSGEAPYPIVVRKELFDNGTVKTAKNLKGLKVGNLAPSGITEYLLNSALIKGGSSLSDVKIVTPMGFPQMVDALSTKALDAALLGEPFAAIAVDKGFGVRITPEYGVGEPIIVIKANREYADKNPETVEQFLAATLKGARDLADGRFSDPANLAIIEKYTKVPVSTLQKSIAPHFPVDGKADPAHVMKQQQYYIDRGAVTLKAPIPAEQVIDTQFLEKAKVRTSQR